MNNERQFNKIKSVAGTIGLLAIGLILCLSGVGIPIGIALIAESAREFTTGQTLSWDDMANKVKKGLEEIAEKFDEFKANVKKKLDGFKEVGQNVIDGFCQGITEFFSDPLGWIKEHIVDPFIQGFKDLFGIHSPSTVMHEIGRFVIEGLLNGILEPIKNIGKWIKKNVVDPITNAIKKNPISDFVMGIKNTASEWWQNAKSWWNEKAGQGLTLEAAVTLAQKGWTTVSGWIGQIPTLSQYIALAKDKWETVKDWIGNIPIIEQGIRLVKDKWETVKDWIGNIPTLEQLIKLAKDRWETVKEWIGNIPSLSQYIHLLKDKWTTVKEWIGNIPVLNQAIQLMKHLWTTVKDWVGNIPVLSQAIQLTKHLWTTVSGWIGNIPVLNQAIQLTKHLWTTVSGWIGSIPVLSQAIQLTKHLWTTVSGWIGNIPVISQGVSLLQSGWTTVSSWVSNKIGGAVGVTVNLLKGWAGTIKNWLGFESGGVMTDKGVQFAANGGVFTNKIPMYANGTNAPSHGTMFVAGEAGPEIVGHINNRSEVMNRFQLASIMKDSVVAGMGQYTAYWRSMNSQMVACSNAVIRSILVSADVLNANMVNLVSYDPTNALSQSVFEDSQSAYMNAHADDSTRVATLDFYQYVESALKELIADTKRQADKEEQTIVQIGNRTITDAVTTQQRANGYSFTR